MLFPVYCALPNGAQLEDQTELDEDAGRRGHEDLLDDVVLVDGAAVFAPFERVVPDGVPRQLFGAQTMQGVRNGCFGELKTLHMHFHFEHVHSESH